MIILPIYQTFTASDTRNSYLASEYGGPTNRSGPVAGATGWRGKLRNFRRIEVRGGRS
jgi:hypothetical protein